MRRTVEVAGALVLAACAGTRQIVVGGPTPQRALTGAALRHSGAAVPLAGTPSGIAQRERPGGPDEARWALERTSAIGAIGRRPGSDTFGLEPDLSRPDLGTRVATMIDGLRRR